jgi:hypothetical protein
MSDSINAGCLNRFSVESFAEICALLLIDLELEPTNEY